MTTSEQNRRKFLRFLAASPLFAQALANQALGQDAAAPTPAAPTPTAKDILNVSEFEPLAHRALPPAHWGYVSTGVDDDATLKANIAAYQRVQLRPHRLVDVSKLDTKVELFGTTWDSPLFLCPVGGQKMFHPEGEVAVARAAKSRKTLQVLSTQTSISVEEVAAARGMAPWYQLYMPGRWEDAVKMVKRVEDAGCPVLVWTVDIYAGRNTETATRLARIDTRNCSACHTVAANGNTGRKEGHQPMFTGLQGGVVTGGPVMADWSFVERLKKITKMKIVLKGIETSEDARLCRETGVDGILVSNHGGRSAEDLRPTIQSLPEVIEAAGKDMTVMVDGGVRRGTDIFKALALGAKAVGIGRPYVYGLAAFGQDGVEKAIDILNAEFQRTMRQCGTKSIRDITSASVRTA